MQNMGDKFKKDETTMFDLYFKEGETGEKALAFITLSLAISKLTDKIS